MTDQPHNPSVRPPHQDRSRQTLDRILRATEQELLTKGFEEISVRAIVKSARTSVGSFYSRFEDKSALLGALYERYADGIEARIEAWRSDQAPPAPSISGAAAWISTFLIDSFRGRRHLLRALALHIRQRPEQVGSRESERRAEQHRFLEEALLEHREQIADPNPERAARTAIYLAACACRERILFQETPHARALQQSDARLAADLTRMIVGYLLCPEPPKNPR